MAIMFTEIAQLYISYLHNTTAPNTVGNATTFLMFTEFWPNLTMEQVYGVVDNMISIVVD